MISPKGTITAQFNFNDNETFDTEAADVQFQTELEAMFTEASSKIKKLDLKSSFDPIIYTNSSYYSDVKASLKQWKELISPNDIEELDRKVDIAICGHKGTGKSTLISVLQKGYSEEMYIPNNLSGTETTKIELDEYNVQARELSWSIVKSWPSFYQETRIMIVNFKELNLVYAQLPSSGNPPRSSNRVYCITRAV